MVFPYHGSGGAPRADAKPVPAGPGLRGAELRRYTPRRSCARRCRRGGSHAAARRLYGGVSCTSPCVERRASISSVWKSRRLFFVYCSMMAPFTGLLLFAVEMTGCVWHN